MKKVYILDVKGTKEIFFIFNNLKKYLKDVVFVGIALSTTEIKDEILKINLIKTENGDFRQFYYKFQNVKIYSLKEGGKIE